MSNFMRIRSGLTLTPTDLPSSPTSGDICYDSSDNKFKLYENGAWISPLSDAAGSIANSSLANMPAYTFKGNNTSTSAAPADITAADLTARLGQFSTTLQGLVPMSGGGTTNFLRADGQWATAGGITSTIGTFDSQSPAASGLAASSGVIYAQSASATVPGMVNTGAQAFAGLKQFEGIGVGTVGTSSDAVLVGSTLSLIGAAQKIFNAKATFTGTTGVSFESAPTINSNLNVLIGFEANVPTVLSGHTVNNYIGFVAGPFASATNNYGFQSSIPAGATNYGFYESAGARSRFEGQVLLATGARISGGTLQIDYTNDSSTGNLDTLSSTSSSIRLTGAAPVIRGISGGIGSTNGRILTIANATGSAITVKNNDPNPSAGNKILTGTSADISISIDSSIMLQYDSASSVWRIVGSSGGSSALTLTGDVTGSGTGSISTAISDATVTGKLITGFTSGAGSVLSSDSVLQAINKLDGNMALKAPIASKYKNVRYVDKSGSDITGDGSVATPYLTVQAAIDSITQNNGISYSLVNIGAGIFTEAVVLKNNVSLRGQSTGASRSLTSLSSVSFAPTSVSSVVLSGSIDTLYCTITGLSSTSGLSVGMSVSGPGFSSTTTKIVSIDSSSAVTVSTLPITTGTYSLTFADAGKKNCTLSGMNIDALNIDLTSSTAIYNVVIENATLTNANTSDTIITGNASSGRHRLAFNNVGFESVANTVSLSNFSIFKCYSSFCNDNTLDELSGGIKFSLTGRVNAYLKGSQIASIAITTSGGYTPSIHTDVPVQVISYSDTAPSYVMDKEVVVNYSGTGALYPISGVTCYNIDCTLATTPGQQLVYLPDATKNTNYCITIKRIDYSLTGAGVIVFTALSSQFIDGISYINITNQNDAATFMSDGIGWRVVSKYNSSLATANTYSFIGNNTGTLTSPFCFTGSQATVMLDSMVGDSGSGGQRGLVPAPASGDAAANKFLKADGTWTTVSAGSPINMRAKKNSGSHATSGSSIAVDAWNTADFNSGLTFVPSTGICTIITTGIYNVSAMVSFAVNATGSRYLEIRKNGSVEVTLDNQIASSTIGNSPTGNALVSCTAGDTLQIYAFQNSGGTLTYQTSTADNWLCINLVR